MAQKYFTILKVHLDFTRAHSDQRCTFTF